MKKFLLSLAVCITVTAFGQFKADEFSDLKTVPVTPVKNQAMSGTCWSFGTTSLVESQCLKNKIGEMDLSEMFVVRNMYIEKARNYVLRKGHAQFGEGGLGHDLLNAIATYGIVPESVYSGLRPGHKMHNHIKLSADLKNYADSILKKIPLSPDWLNGYIKILDAALGEVPAAFEYSGKRYTPKSFAEEVVKFNRDDYVSITSFTHEPYYSPFILQVPDNFSNGSFYNLPLNEMIQLTKDALKNGYSVMWDADVSNNGFMQDKGLALLLDDKVKPDLTQLKADIAENPWDAASRQELYENLTTQDDHLMHLFGMERSKEGKTFFVVKNSWGAIGPYQGTINVSEAYFAMNTVSLVVPKAAIGKALLAKLKIK